MKDIASNIEELRSRIPDYVKIIAVSKTIPVHDILKAYSAGQRIFGENRVREYLSKRDDLPDDIHWHFIGHLQSNKIRQIVSSVEMIHSVDSFRLLNTLNAEAVKAGRIVDCLIQFHIADEKTKSGFTIGEVEEMLQSQDYSKMAGIRICGVMGMATFTPEMEKVRQEFRNLKRYFELLKERYFPDRKAFSEVSMGMSGDYNIAVEEGSTMIRIGSLIFGSRR